ncbi:MAG: MFS transporter [Anaerolineae bacterium]|nr:MFS transporter [Anaerolineae bacterium]
MRRRAVFIFYVIQAVSAFGFALIFTTNLIYQAEVVGLNPLQLVLVGTTLEVTAFLFEIPTGVVADLYSRRLSVIIGYLLVGVGFLVEGSLPFFWAILLNQVIWGIGITFTSGALEAWIADETDPTALGPILLRGSQLGSVAGILGTLLSGALGSIALALPVVSGGAIFILLSAALVAAMPETGFAPTPREAHSSLTSMAQTTRAAMRVVRLRPILIVFLLIASVIGAHSEGFDRLWREHLMENFTFPSIGGWQPIVWFSLIALANHALSIAAAEVVRRRVKTDDQAAVARAVKTFYGGMAAALIMFGLSDSFLLALVAYLASQTLRSISEPLMNTWTNQHIDSRVRATVISSLHQFDAIGQFVGGPAVGLVGLRVGLRAALALTGVILAPVVWLVAQASRLSGEEPEAAADD